MALAGVKTEELEGDLVLERLQGIVVYLHSKFTIGCEDKGAWFVWDC